MIFGPKLCNTTEVLDKLSRYKFYPDKNLYSGWKIYLVFTLYPKYTGGGGVYSGPESSSLCTVGLNFRRFVTCRMVCTLDIH